MPLGRWFRVSVRVHALFVAAAIVALFLCTSGGNEAPGYGALSVAILFFSVLAHEAGHCWVAVRSGGSAEGITISPLGGLSDPEVPRESQAELLTALAGPLVNLAILLVTLPLLVTARVSVSPLLNPLAPGSLIAGGWWEVTLKLAFWTNWLLLSVNLLPAFPFDGARLLRALLWPALDQRAAGLAVVRISKLTALGACILAWVLRDKGATEALPHWVPLALFAVFVYFSTQHEAARLEAAEWDEEVFSYDFSQGYTSLERGPESLLRPSSSLRRWLQNRREQRRQRRACQEQEEERQVDEILVRLHETGMNSLSAKERAILDRVSARYRNRQRN